MAARALFALYMAFMLLARATASPGKRTSSGSRRRRPPLRTTANRLASRVT
jgi:hypothetical protein